MSDPKQTVTELIESNRLVLRDCCEKCADPEKGKIVCPVALMLEGLDLITAAVDHIPDAGKKVSPTGRKE